MGSKEGPFLDKDHYGFQDVYIKVERDHAPNFTQANVTSGSNVRITLQDLQDSSDFTEVRW